MFCYQCEQVTKGVACTTHGACGKDPETAALQDILVYMVKGISIYAKRARTLGVKDMEIDIFVLKALYITLTNVNFDPASILQWLNSAVSFRDKIRKLYQEACKKNGLQEETLDGPAKFIPAEDLDNLIVQGEELSIVKRKADSGDDITGLQELLTYGLKGLAAYAIHAYDLGKHDDAVFAFVHEALDFLTKPAPKADDLLGFNLKCGEVNLRVMELLDTVHTDHYGHPIPTNVRIEPLKGKAILVSGHDLGDLEELLRQTEGKGINIYTHGEMLPAHGYPMLKKYKHLVGNYGGAWQDQLKEFNKFPGAILMTTNCILKPKDSYVARIFATSVVGAPGVTHIGNKDFTPVIEAALAEKGFTEDGSDKTILVGFGHNAVLGVADKVIDAVKSGDIKHFFLVGGCDGAKSGRNYYYDFAKAVPDDSVILTLACGKYRFNKLDFGDIGGIPRLLDIGQCNDAHSAIQIAVALANAFETDVNGLPLSFILSWFEQKAVVILLSLLHLGIKDIRIGPSLPAFITPTVLDILVDKFNIMPITTAKEDLAAILG
ncbi:MAG: hydroxylamine reductase [Candidatus Latescibacteria bacterium]|nr:hydroxylamine reductase [Candidatus Latescibacterota bacterium]